MTITGVERITDTERLRYRVACSECGEDHWLPARTYAAPFVCPTCWFWYQFQVPAAQQAPRIVVNGVLYGIDMRDSAEGVGKRYTVRYFDIRDTAISTRRLRVIGETPVGTPDTAIVQRVPR